MMIVCMYNYVVTLCKQM